MALCSLSLTPLVGRGRDRQALLKTLENFSYKSRSAPRDLAAIKSDVDAALRIIPQLIKQKDRPDYSKLNLVTLLGQLQTKDAKIRQNVNGVAADIAVDSRQKVTLRNQAARILAPKHLSADKLQLLIRGHIRDLKKGGKPPLTDAIKKLPGGQKIPKHLESEIVRAFPAVMKSQNFGENVIDFIRFSRRVNAKATSAALLASMTVNMAAPLSTRRIWDKYLTKEERKAMIPAYTKMLSAWIVTGVVTRPDDIRRIGQGFETTLLQLLVHNLSSTNPHARVDAAIALRKIYGGRTMGYNPAADKHDRDAAIKKWKLFASCYKPPSPPKR